jgi:hypothetical protein
MWTHSHILPVIRLILWTLQPHTAGYTTYTVDTTAIRCRLCDIYCGNYSQILPDIGRKLWTLQPYTAGHRTYSVDTTAVYCRLCDVCCGHYSHTCILPVVRRILWGLQPYTDGHMTYTVDTTGIYCRFTTYTVGTTAIYCRLYDVYCVHYSHILPVVRRILWKLQQHTAGYRTYTVDNTVIYFRLYDVYCGHYSHILPVVRHILWALQSYTAGYRTFVFMALYFCMLWGTVSTCPTIPCIWIHSSDCETLGISCTMFHFSSVYLDVFLHGENGRGVKMNNLIHLVSRLLIILRGGQRDSLAFT